MHLSSLRLFFFSEMGSIAFHCLHFVHLKYVIWFQHVLEHVSVMGSGIEVNDFQEQITNLFSDHKTFGLVTLDGIDRVRVTSISTQLQLQLQPNALVPDHT